MKKLSATMVLRIAVAAGLPALGAFGAYLATDYPAIHRAVCYGGN